MDKNGGTSGTPVDDKTVDANHENRSIRPAFQSDSSYAYATLQTTMWAKAEVENSRFSHIVTAALSNGRREQHKYQQYQSYSRMDDSQHTEHRAGGFWLACVVLAWQPSTFPGWRIVAHGCKASLA